MLHARAAFEYDRAEGVPERVERHVRQSDLIADFRESRADLDVILQAWKDAPPPIAICAQVRQHFEGRFSQRNVFFLFLSTSPLAFDRDLAAVFDS